MPSTDPAILRAVGQIAANKRWAHEPDRTAATSAARAAQHRALEDEVDPDRVLTPEERAKRVKNALRARMQRMALKSAQARKRRNDQPAKGSAADRAGGVAR